MNDEVKYIVTRALEEDIGKGDITTDAVYSGSEKSEGTFIAKQDGVVAGLALAEFIFAELSDEIRFISLVQDGEKVKKGTEIASIKGPAGKILTGERTALNFMQRMSGIATETDKYVALVNHTSAKILDTRKTAPGHRYLDKWAVRLGGGTNHRMRLDDRFLIKENHITVSGSIPKAVQSCLYYKSEHKLDAEIEIEVQNLDQLDEVLALNGVTYVLLDNMSVAEMSHAVQKTKGKVLLEASGNVNLSTVKEIAETGVDFISVGGLTHSVTAMDISLIFKK